MMMDEHELRLLKLVLHAASQHAYHWVHPNSVQELESGKEVAKLESGKEVAKLESGKEVAKLESGKERRGKQALRSEAERSEAGTIRQGLQWRGRAKLESGKKSDERSEHELSCRDWQELVRVVAARCKDVLPLLPLRKALREDKLLARQLHSHVQNCAEYGAEIVVWGDRHYPARLRTIPDPPLALTMLGNTTLLDLPNVAIVGSRKASPRGLRESFALGRVVAQRGWAVVSGGAYGCDIAAHRGALAASVAPVPAIVVFAGGFASLHPRGNAATFRDLRRHEALFVSERLWHTPSRPCDFPVRNRIIAGLSPTLMVMEAGERSGALLTAGLSLNQGAEVWVLQHPAGDVRTAGSQRLIAEGAPSFAAASSWQQELESGKEVAELESGKEVAELESGKEVAELESGKEVAELESGKEVAELESGKEVAELESGKEVAELESGKEVVAKLGSGREAWSEKAANKPREASITNSRVSEEEQSEEARA